MAEMFLELDQVKGESLDQTHKDQIEIKSWSWNTANTVRWDVNQGGQSTKVVIEHIILKKVCDKASPTLHQCCVTGRHIKKGKITCRKNDGDNKFEYMIIDLTDIMVSQFQWSGLGDEPALEETIGITFAEYKIDYKIQSDTGQASGASSFAFNVQRQAGHGAN